MAITATPHDLLCHGLIFLSDLCVSFCVSHSFANSFLLLRYKPSPTYSRTWSSPNALSSAQNSSLSMFSAISCRAFRDAAHNTKYSPFGTEWHKREYLYLAMYDRTAQIRRVRLLSRYKSWRVTKNARLRSRLPK